MSTAIAALANLDALAFAVLGAATGITWLRNRDASTGYLALAIVLLSLVSLLGRVPVVLHVKVPLLSQVNLIAFAGSGYALLRYRAALIPLSRGLHAAAAGLLALTSATFLVASLAGAPAAFLLWSALGLVLVWAAVVLESIVRFWLVAGGLPAVQAWRLRSLSLGFAGIVAILLLAVGAAGTGTTSLPSIVQLGIQVAVLAVVPLLYVSFSPPSWLRREWRATEEEGLRAYMESLLVDGDTESLNRGGLEWAARITGAGGAAAFDSRGDIRSSIGLDTAQLAALRQQLPDLPDGFGRHDIGRGASAVAVVPLVGPDAPERLVLVAGPFTPAFGTDELSRVQQFMTAVTAGLDRQRLVEDLKSANAQLKEASEHKSVFLANMSHELRTPLNAIIGFSELMLDAREEQFDQPTQKRFLSQVHTSGKHLLGLINDILDLSKVEAGQMELRPQTVEIELAVAQVLSTIEPLAIQKKIKLESAIKGAGEVTADPGKLKQMLLNLVSNAIKFTPDGGTVTVTSRREPSAVEISVTDTGIGIPKEDQKRIFREFQQLDTGPGRREQGTGLGLALTRRFALLHGGDVTVQSEAGRGSIFTLRLPVLTAAPAPAAVAPRKRRPADDPRPLVLVIEDDAAAAELLARQLQAGGFRTEVVRTGTEAIASAKALHPEAITLDILLPELDGWEVMSRLKADPETADIPVIVVSVIDNPDLGMALGALDYFVKPVDGRQLVQRLARFKRKPSQPEQATTVLVVDDEAANRQWLTRILEPAGFTVEVATGGQEAIDMAKASPPDLVLLDLMMPTVTGFDVVEALRSDVRTQDTPIMILTARHLTAEDKRHLNGHVSTILRRGSVGASDLVGLLQQVVTNPGDTPS
jgi:signal transduction histidine kinase/CheY-like chemotaxis protein